MFVRCGKWLKVESSFPKLDTDLVSVMLRNLLSSVQLCQSRCTRLPITFHLSVLNFPLAKLLPDKIK